MPADPAVAHGLLPIDASKLHDDVCQEILNEAQGMVKTQLDAAEALATKLTDLLGQATTLAIAAFGAAALAFPSSTPSWMPRWGAVGLLVAGIFWGITAFKAADGLKPHQWQIGFSPKKLWIPKILNAPSAGEAFLYIASQTQQMIDKNDALNRKLAGELVAAQWYFTRALLFGLVAAILTALALHWSAQH